MIPRVRWADDSFAESASPFSGRKGKAERPIRVTFHGSSFSRATQEELQVINLLYELSHLSEIEAISMDPDSLPYMEIGAYENDAASIPVTMVDGDQRTLSAIQKPDYWLEIASKLAKQNNKHRVDVQAIFQDILIGRASDRLRQDLLITLSPILLENRDKPYVRSANPRTPSEAAKIVGLLLRSQENYVYQAGPGFRASLGRSQFYWSLTRHKLPNMWRYFSACVHAEAVREDDILYLGQSILVRCTRALEARDAIGVQFYSPQSNVTRDGMMYHFDYLTLLLLGAFDAQARVARRAYEVDTPERHSGFQYPDFRKLLKRSGATELCELVSGQYFTHLMILLRAFRNTIHGAALPTIGYHQTSQSQASFVKVLPQYRDKVWRAAKQCGSVEKWGLVKDHELLFEPYTFSVTLVDECLKHVDAIAELTDVSGLFPAEYALPTLQENAPDDGVFAETARKRLAILG